MKKFSDTKLIIAIITAFLLNVTNICPVYAYDSLEFPENLVTGEKNLPSAAQNSNDVTNVTPVKNVNTQYIVSLDGLGDFISIQEAVNYAKDGDTLIIYPGIYKENIDVIDKTINIIGIDKNSCILQYDTSSYWKVPLNIAAGTVANLTIYGIKNIANTTINNDIQSEYLFTDETDNYEAQMRYQIWEQQKTHTGYTIHIEQNFLYGKGIHFKNCNIISENNHCIGIGSRGNSNIKFEDCKIISNGIGGCFYLHDFWLPEYQGDVNFTLKNCTLTSYRNPYVMTIQSLSPFNPTYLTFENVKVSSVVYDEMTCFVPGNINTSFDIDTLLLLDKGNQLEYAGLTSTVMHNMVQELSLKDSHKYMKTIDEIFETKNITSIHNILPEGITFIKNSQKSDNSFDINTTNNIKKSILYLQNASGQTGNGWCGLDNVYLTPDSYGNTLIEMNSTSFNGLGYYENNIY